MAVVNPPWTLENLATHHANVNRMLMAALTGRAEGVAYGMGVVQRAAGANMSVDIGEGTAVVFGDENAQQGVYGVTNDATLNVAVSAASASIIRWDLVVARVRDAFYSGATNAWALEVVPGTVASTDPTVPANALVLARIVVGVSVSSITTANITDLRPFLYGNSGVIPVNSARPPGVLYGPYSQEAAVGFRPAPLVGSSIVETDTGRFKLHDGTAYRYVAGGPQPQYAARGWRSAALNLANGTWTLLAMDNESYDYNSNFSVATGKYTVPVTGLYDIRGRASWGVNAAATASLVGIFINAVETSRGSYGQDAGAVVNFGHNVADTLALTAGDLVDLRAFNGSGNVWGVETGQAHVYIAIRKV